MEKCSPSAEALAAWDEVVATMTAEHDVVKAPMFGMPSLKHRGGKAFAGLRGDTMTFKLVGAAHAEALALDGAVFFDPSGTVR